MASGGNQFVTRGVEIVKQAVIADNNDELPQALKLYRQALEYFMTGMKHEKNPTLKERVRLKTMEYMDRAEEIQRHLDSGDKKKKKKAVVGGGGGRRKAPGGTGDEDGKDGDATDEDPDAAKLNSAISQAIVAEKPNVKWSDVAGLEQAKDLLKEAVILPVRFPELFQGKRTPWRGILLYGPPGTGKSYLAKAVATEADSTFLSVSSSDLVSKYQGESERLVRSMFEVARAKAPTIIFIDEVDSLCSARGEGENESARRIKTEFLVQMQGVGKGNDGVLVLGATNVPWELDSAIRRRFEKRVYVPLPDVAARREIFKIHLGPNMALNDDDLDFLAKQTEGFSGADISVCVRDALYEPVRTCQVATHFRKVQPPPDRAKDGVQFLYEPCAESVPGAIEMTLMDVPAGSLHPPPVNRYYFERALLNSKASVGKDDLKQHEDWTSEFGQEG